MSSSMVAIANKFKPIPSTRLEARQQDAQRYNTGIPCKRGHISDRYTKSGNCIACFGGYAKVPPQNVRHPNGFLVRRTDAKKMGESRYYTGPCSEGHDSPRYTANGHCVVCTKKKSAEWREKNGERYKAAADKWHKDNAEYMKLYHKARRERIKEQQNGIY